MHKNHKKVLLIDLDGVLNQYSGNFQEDKIPSIKSGAKEFLESLSENYQIKIFTTRNKLLTAKWIIENNIDKYITDITNTKELAYLYIDDRCINFKGEFQNILKEIEHFKCYWE